MDKRELPDPMRTGKLRAAWKLVTRRGLWGKVERAESSLQVLQEKKEELSQKPVEGELADISEPEKAGEG